MLKTIARLEHKIGDRVFHLLCDSDSPIPEVKESLSQFMGYVVAVEKNAEAAQKAKEEVENEVVVEECHETDEVKPE